MTTPQRATTSKILLVVGAILFFLAALTETGSDIAGTPALAWAFGGFAAWCLAGAV